MKYVVDIKDVKPMSAKNHTGTLNRMLITKESGIDSFTLNYGELVLGAQALPHSHTFDQACYVLGGKLKVTIGGNSQLLTEGMLYFAPAGLMHQSEVIEGPVKALVIYGKDVNK